MSTTEAESKVFEEIAQLFGSGPTDEQILNFRLSADVTQRAAQLLSLTQPIPHLPLFVPVERLGDGADVGIFDCVADLGGSGQEEDLFLDVSGEVV